MNQHPYKKEERLLTVDNVSVSYGDKQILRDVSFHIDNITRPGMQQGQVVGMLGPSGMGKTQLFRCIAGLQKPTKGSVTLMDKETRVNSGDVGVVMQHYPLLQHRTVMGNLMLVTKDKEKAEAMLARFGLADKVKSYPSELSGGQRQRVAIIQQLLCSNHYLLMDEPFSGLDPLAKMDVIKLINEIASLDELNTIIVITHDIEYSLLISDTIIMLGRDRDENGNPIPGARIQKTVDLIERDLCWHPQVEYQPEYVPTLREIKDSFNQM